MDQVLLFFALKYHGNWNQIYDALEKKEKISDEELKLVESQIDCKYLTIINPLYPKSLKNSYQPPFVLFYDGDINLLIDSYKIIGIVGETKISDYSFSEAKKLLKKLSEEHKTILTIDGSTAFKMKFNQQILLTTQLENVIREPNQLVISESYEQNELLDRQRLLFSMSNFLLVTQLEMKNSLFDKLKIMIGNNQEIFVIPQENSSLKLANNWLIKQGAKLVEVPSDILNDF